ncbi:uncharacterized protein LOC118437460 isoform X2 [Folsomia candida]|uniref:uncharacterized protein LOC118437460 isoform X2 n=1 Tax=Folsomia candida TaxID=158441 RepID=UPI001604AA57|nr:uncharacterized protein LOC118437460 isoform X2 [Folsomia candida]
MAVDDNPPQLVTSLPEIIGKITSFLPISDLLTCTKVNAGWEREARNHIRARSVFSGRFLGYYESYGEVMSVRTSYYETMRINWEYNQELDDFLPRFKNLAEQCTGKVRHLTLSVFLDGGKRPMEFFRIIKLFGNHLTSLQFTFFTKLDVFYDRQKCLKQLWSKNYSIQQREPPLTLEPSILKCCYGQCVMMKANFLAE